MRPWRFCIGKVNRCRINGEGGWVCIGPLAVLLIVNSVLSQPGQPVNYGQLTLEPSH